MQVIEPELEIGHVTETTSMVFEGFGFVVATLDQATGDAVKVIVHGP